MAYTKVAAVTPNVAGTATYTPTAPSGTGAGNGDSIPVGSILLVTVGATPTVLTLNVPITYEGLVITSPTVSLSANGSYALGPFNEDPWMVQSGTDAGYVHIDYSSITTVTRTVLLSPR